MNMDLYETLENFKIITLKLIEELEKDNFDELDSLLNLRQLEIDKMDNINYTKEEFKKLCMEYKILALQERLTKLMNQKRMEVRNEIDKLSEAKSANKSYNKRFSIDSIYFNKKI